MQERSPATDVVDLSVIVVSWNTRELTRNCLRSVLDNIGALSREIFVVDNASDDGSSDTIAREFPSVKLIRNDANLGFAAANNQAMRLANGRYVLLLNSDTEVLGDVLKKCVRYMDEHDDVGILGCRVLNSDRTLQPTCFQYPTLANLFLWTSGLARLPWPRFLGKYQMAHWKRDTERDVNVVTGCFMVVRQATIRQIGLMDESFFFFAEETDWCRRFNEHGSKVRFAPIGEIIHHRGASAKQLDYRRDKMLIRALVDYHRKHNGPIAAFAAWGIMLVYCLSRYGLWLLISLVRRNGRAGERRALFHKLLTDFPDIHDKQRQSR